MSHETFGDFINKVRNTMQLPLRNIEAFYDIDQPKLNKMEPKIKPASQNYLQFLPDIFK